jgi:hypothetical protein
LYRDQPGAAEAMAEVRSIASRCPSSPVPGSQVGEPPLSWKVTAASQSGWPSAPGLDRVALHVTLSEPAGGSEEQLVVYLRRGRLLLGIYFETPDGPQPPVDGQSTIAGIMGVLQQRIEALPAAEVG